MNKVKKVITSPFFAIGAFALAAVLLLSAGIGGASAALNSTSDVYELKIETQNIGVVVNEGTTAANASPVENGKLTYPGVPSEYNFDVEYPEVLSVTNTGEIGEYVRVIVTKYWTDGSGEKLTYDQAKKLSPDTIDLNFVESDLADGWTIHDESTTDERTILNYNGVLASGQTTTPFTNLLTIDGDELLSHVKTVTNVVPTDDGTGYKTTSTTTIDLGEVSFNIDVEVQAVQEHNGGDAMMSAWGYKTIE